MNYGSDEDRAKSGGKAMGRLDSTFEPQRNEKSLVSYEEYPINAKTEIRILSLLPPDIFDTQKIHCTLLIAKLVDSPQYEALSYAWGESVFPERLYLPPVICPLPRISQQPCVISDILTVPDECGSTLYVLISRIIQRKATKLALCLRYIDKHNVGWLDTCKAFAMIKDTAALATEFGIRFQDTFHESFLRNSDEKSKTALVEFSKRSNSHFVRHVLLLPWFQRLWIVREAALPRKFTLCLGQSTLEFDIEERLFDHDTEYLIQALQLAADREGIQNTIKHGLRTQMTFIDRLDTYSNRDCTNDVDRIYGLIGLQTDWKEPIEPKYGESVEKVYLDFAYNTLQRHGLRVLHFSGRNINGPRLGILSGASESEMRLLESAAMELPSWVPDWRHERAMLDFCSDDFAAATQLPLSTSLDKKYMPFIGMCGVRIDVVTLTLASLFPKKSKLLSLGDFWRESPLDMVNLRAVFLNGSPPHRYSTKEHAELAFARTMVLDNRTMLTRPMLPHKMNVEHLISAWKLFESQADITVDDAAGKTPYGRAAAAAGVQRTFFMTKSGHIGIAPKLTRLGDTIAVFDGDKSAYVLGANTRDYSAPHWSASSAPQFNPKEQWELVGDCYLHGFMDNEVAQPEWREKKEIFWIT